MEDVFIKDNEESHRKQVDEDDVDAIIGIFVILQSDGLIGAEKDDCTFVERRRGWHQG